MHARLMRRIKYSAAFWPLNRRRQQSVCSISASSFLLRNAPQAELMHAAAAAEDNSLWDGSAAQRVIKLLLPWALDLLSLTRIQRATLNSLVYNLPAAAAMALSLGAYFSLSRRQVANIATNFYYLAMIWEGLGRVAAGHRHFCLIFARSGIIFLVVRARPVICALLRCKLAARRLPFHCFGAAGMRWLSNGWKQTWFMPQWPPKLLCGHEIGVENSDLWQKVI